MISVGKVMSYNIDPLFVTQTLKDARETLEYSPLCGLPVVDHKHKVLGVLFKDCNLLKFREDTPLGK
ncbi:MAG TPA: CBS domain-containing protein [Candidatus Deferrimicrobium sp.]|nr:CBS domain-containing protein [Candidatus Deferrimicrobium sp.]